MDSSVLVELVVWYAVFLFSTSLHEAMHALTASFGGDKTAQNSGQATLNPLPHIRRERLGMVIVPLLSFFLNFYQTGSGWMFGWASAPFNPYWAARHPRRAFAMSLAGPLAHLLPATVAWIAMAVGLRTGLFQFGARHGLSMLVVPTNPDQPLLMALCMILGILFQLNIILCIFNLLPLPPMDGSEVWYFFIKREEDRLRWRYTFNSYSLAGLMLAWYVFPRVFMPVYWTLLSYLRWFGAA